LCGCGSRADGGARGSGAAGEATRSAGPADFNSLFSDQDRSTAVDPGVARRLAMGKTVAPLRAHADVARMHGSRDLVAASMEMMAGRLTPAAYLRSWRKPLVLAAFAKDDPVPGLVDLPLAAARVLERYWARASARPAHGAHRSRLRTSH